MNSVNFLNLEYIYLRIVDLFQNFDIVTILNWFIWFRNIIEPFAIAVTIFLAYVIIYSHVKIHYVEKDMGIKYKAMHEKKAEKEASGDPALHEKWQQIQEHIASTNPSDWRLAILEADIMMNDILEKMGFQGDTIGDKLKGADKSDFLTLDLAWEAHKVRNQIAHEGTDFKLEEREARHTIDLYRKVFEEFYHIQ